MATKQAKRLPPAAGKGRPKGSKNKINADVRKMILAALEGAGGQQYLQRQANENPTAFLTLVGKVVPKEITGGGGTPLVPRTIEIVAGKG